MENTHMKIRIVAEEKALIQLDSNKEFYDGKMLRYIFRNLADIILIMDEDEFEHKWKNSESALRSFFSSYDMPLPQAISDLKQIYNDPGKCLQFDPFAIWLFDKPESDIKKLQEYIGVWALRPESLSDDYFRLGHSRKYEKNDVVEGEKGNGWGNFFGEIPKPLPPRNSIVLNDRYLLTINYIKAF